MMKASKAYFKWESSLGLLVDQASAIFQGEALFYEVSAQDESPSLPTANHLHSGS